MNEEAHEFCMAVRSAKDLEALTYAFLLSSYGLTYILKGSTNALTKQKIRAFLGGYC